MDWKNRRKWYKIVSGLACIVVFCTVYALILPAVTLERPAKCGVEEHTHTEECYTDGVLSCGKEEHVHTEACYAAETETETSKAAAAETETVAEETEQTEQTEKMAEETEMTSESGDDSADVETADDWEKTIAQVALTGDWAKDLQAIAESQIGYKESTENYIIDETGKKCGYSRYGQWYGDPYSEWSTLFVSWCLHYAKVENIPEQSDCVKWIAQLKEKNIYRDAAEYVPEAGDIVLLDQNAADDQSADHAGVITEVKDNQLTVIEGDLEDQVQSVTYSVHAKEVVGYVELPKNPKMMDAVSEKNEDTEAQADENNMDTEEIADVQDDAEDRMLEDADDAEAPAKEDIQMHAADSDDINFGPYITSSSVKKLENGVWKESTTFTDGDQVQVTLEYELPADTVNSGSDTIYYQLPAGVRPIQNESGKVYHDGKYVGDYLIDTDGVIAIKFNEEFANGEAFSGKIEFQGTLSNSEAGEGGKIQFDGSGGEITVEPQKAQYDIRMTKTGSLSEDGKTISYVLTASTTKGTEDTVTIKDKFNDSSAKGQYNKDARIYKVDANGTRSEVTGYNPKYEGNSFTIENLPKLNAGEQYVVEYTAQATATNADGSGSLSNSASAESKGQKYEVWNNVDVAESMVSKEGGYDNIRNTINWTITVNQARKDLNGYTIRDDLTSEKGTVKGPSKVTLKNNQTGETQEVTLPYTFDSSTNDTYTITYETPAGSTDDTVTNTVTVTDKDGKSYTGRKVVGVTMRQWKISKSWAKEGVSDSDQKLYYWNAEVTIPEGNLTDFTYTDTIENAVCNGETKENSHYAIAAELQKVIEQNLKLVTADGDLGYNNDKAEFEITYYDQSGNVVPASDNTTHVVKFTIHVKSKDGVKISAKKLQLNDYPTVVDTADAKEGESWTFSNKGSIPQADSKAEHTFDKKKTLDKQAGLKVDNNNISYSDGNLTIGYESTGGILYYRILINTEKGQNEAITLQDVLPKGVQLVENSVEVKFYDSEYYQPSEKWPSTGNYNLEGNQKPTVTTSPRTDGTTELKVVIPEGYNGPSDANAFVVYYQVAIDQDADWSDMKTEEKTYVNQATWNGNEADQRTTVEREVVKLDKTAQQLQDSDGKYINVVEYQVIINPAGENLNPASSELTLTDTLTLPDGVDASLDLKSTALYQYSRTAEKNRGNAIDSVRYSVSYDENTHKMKVVVPDELPCVFVYRYTIDNGDVAKPTIQNNISLMGTEWYSANSKALQEISSSAEVQKGKLTIYKVDSANYKKTLPGAEFLLDVYDTHQSKWVGVNTDGAHNDCLYTTDEKGEIVFQGSQENKVLLSNHLYRLTEKKAPNGYTKSDHPYYFVLMKSKNQYDSSIDKNKSLEELAYNDMKSVFDSTKVSRDDVTFRANDAQASVYIPNDYANITVKKVWVDADGSTMKNPPSSVDVQLYRQIQKPKGYKVTLNIYQLGNTSDIKWTKTIQVKENTSITLTWPSEWNANEISDSSRFSIPSGCSIGIQGNTNRGKPVITTGAITSDCTLSIGCSWYDSGAGEPTLDYTRDYEVVKEAVENGRATLHADNNWQKTWENLDKQDSNGNLYYYTVEEVNAPAGYTVTISNNEGIQRGDIVITNKKDGQSQDYELPKTGGMGTTGYTLGGLLLMAAAGIFMYKQKSRRKEEKKFTL